MAKSRTTTQAFGGEASWFAAPGETIAPSDKIECAIRGCHTYPYIGTFVCWGHLIAAVEDFQDILKIKHARPPQSAIQHIVGIPEPEPKEQYQAFVYYLMIGPSTVKIGTTRNLENRVRTLRSELQYVVALEKGSYDIERQRHRDYAEERTGKYEHFLLSERLKAHIAALMPQRDQLIEEATTNRRLINAG